MVTIGTDIEFHREALFFCCAPFQTFLPLDFVLALLCRVVQSWAALADLSGGVERNDEGQLSGCRFSIFHHNMFSIKCWLFVNNSQVPVEGLLKKRKGTIVKLYSIQTSFQESNIDQVLHYINPFFRQDYQEVQQPHLKKIILQIK